MYIGRNAGSLVDGRNALGDRFPAQSPPRRLIGKVHSRFGRLYIAFRGVEYFYDEYEVLALNQSPAALQVSVSIFCNNREARFFLIVCFIAFSIWLKRMAYGARERLFYGILVAMT